MTAPRTPRRCSQEVPPAPWRIAIPGPASAVEEWLRDVLEFDVRSTLGRAHWRPQALCIAVYSLAGRAGTEWSSAWPTLDQLARHLNWAPTLVRRHLDLAHAAGLLDVLDQPAVPPVSNAGDSARATG